MPARMNAGKEPAFLPSRMPITFQSSGVSPATSSPRGGVAAARTRLTWRYHSLVFSACGSNRPLKCMSSSKMHAAPARRGSSFLPGHFLRVRADEPFTPVLSRFHVEAPNRLQLPKFAATRRTPLTALELPMIIPVILAGGSGSRLWPLSRAQHPKQFHALVSGEPLLADTARRVPSAPPYAPPLVITNEQNRFGVAAAFKNAKLPLAGHRA